MFLMFNFISSLGMYFIGAVISIITFTIIFKKNGYSIIDGLILTILQIIFAYIFAAIFASIEALSFAYTGVSFYGTIFSLSLIPFIYSKIRRLDFIETLDLITPLHMLMLVFMKIGCYIEGCCYGIEINGYQVPIQLIEAGIALIIFVTILVFNRFINGYSYPYLLIVYGTCRFVIEFFRFHWNLLFDLISIGQLWSIVSIILGIIIIIVKKVREKRLKMD
ncbi:MAG: prolipoprotein diacylglyceryl transferase [Bacilli bacterium]|nr:prolipoprotein diacylglyceryl transferase [Bacilli bacterium]